MRQYLFQYVVAAFLFMTADFVWLRSMGPSFYAAELAGLMRDEPNLAVAVAFYLLFVAGLVVFVIHPSAGGSSLAETAIRGGFFGLVAYATYDLTNLATLKGFSSKLALVDMTWGTVLSAAVCCASILLLRRFGA